MDSKEETSNNSDSDSYETEDSSLESDSSEIDSDDSQEMINLFELMVRKESSDSSDISDVSVSSFSLKSTSSSELSDNDTDTNPGAKQNSAADSMEKKRKNQTATGMAEPNTSASRSKKNAKKRQSKKKRLLELAKRRSKKAKEEIISYGTELDKRIAFEWEESKKIAQQKKYLCAEKKRKAEKIAKLVADKVKGKKISEKKKPAIMLELDWEAKILYHNKLAKLNGGKPERETKRKRPPFSTTFNPATIFHSDSEEDSPTIGFNNYNFPPNLPGRLFTMGTELYNELGPKIPAFNGKLLNKNELGRVQLFGNCKIVHVACGFNHSLVITDKGQVLSFGRNHNDVLGRSLTNENEYADFIKQKYIVDPEYVEELIPIQDKNEFLRKNLITNELEKNLATNVLPIKSIPVKVVKVSAGEMHSAALGLNGKVYVWGQFKSGNSKVGLFPDSKPDPDSKSDYLPTKKPKIIPLKKYVDEIASGSNHLLLLAMGICYTIGDGTRGQLGRIEKEDLNSINSKRMLFLKPKHVRIKARIFSIFASHNSSFALTYDGRIYGWGSNNILKFFIPTQEISIPIDDTITKEICALTPYRLPLPFQVDQVAIGKEHLILMDKGGNISTTEMFQAFDKGADIKRFHIKHYWRVFSLFPKIFFHNERVIKICCSDFVSFAITEKGSLFCWSGEKDRFCPRLVHGGYADCTKFFAIAAGSNFAVLTGNYLNKPFEKIAGLFNDW